MSERKSDVLGQIDHSKATVATPAYMRRRRCIRRQVGASLWCEAHGAYFVAGRMFCWATVRPSDVDPLDATTRAGYDSGPTRRVVINERPVVDDRGMVIVWIVAALAFVAAMVVTILAVAGRPPNG